jgi:hypothetical protein
MGFRMLSLGTRREDYQVTSLLDKKLEIEGEIND